MEASRQRVRLTREKKDLEREVKDVSTRIAKLDEVIEAAMLAGEFPISSKVDGAAVFMEQTIWASPLGGDHASLTLALDDLGLEHLLPDKVNSQKLSAYVREHIDPDRELSLEERIERGHPENGRLPDRLISLIKVSQVDKPKVTGA